MGIIGSGDVVVGGKYRGPYAFGGITDEIESIKWMDNNAELSYIQGKGMLAVNLSGHEYGRSYPVRVAKAKIK